jgi:hypothetical protein
MRVYGINYDVGFASAGTTTHEPFDPDSVRREMHIIRADLHCDAVRISGADPDRLEIAARHAAEAGLEVWYSPFTNGLTLDELLELLIDGAERAERLRRDGASLVFLTGSEISLFNADRATEPLTDCADGSGEEGVDAGTHRRQHRPPARGVGQRAQPLLVRVTRHEATVVPDRLVLVPAGTRHNFVNSGSTDLRLYAIYAPPEHAPGTIHRTKTDADAAEDAEQ